MDYTADPAKLAPDDLEVLQQELQTAGFYKGTIDGECGPGTRKAFKLARLAHAAAHDTPVLVIDINHDEGFDDEADFQLLWDLGVRVIIHKGTQGRSVKDKTYHARKAVATQATATREAFKWGIYHFSSGHDVQEQIANFFAVEDGSDHTITYWLDWEDSTDGTENMPLASALAFMTAIEERTGAPGGVYGSNQPRESTNGHVDAVLLRAIYWQAGRGPVPPTFAKRGMILFQYADTQLGGQPGVDLDRPCEDGAKFLADYPFR